MTQQHKIVFGFDAPNSVLTNLGYLVSWNGCKVMGILNATPDSFSDGGKHAQLDRLISSAEKMQSRGVFILDIGGESTRPNSEPVNAETELDRVLPAILALRNRGILLSIDTTKPEVAHAALKAGAHIVNDISGLSNPEMLSVCAKAGAPACIMHMQGSPKTMQVSPNYSNVVAEVHGFLCGQAAKAKAAGAPSVILDVGIGFGKALSHNLDLLRAAEDLVSFGDPVLLGASRKSLISLMSGETSPAERDAGSIAIHLDAARRGVALVRAHAAAEHAQAILVQEIIMNKRQL